MITNTPSWVSKLPEEMRFNVTSALIFYATDAYLEFFRAPIYGRGQWRWTEGTKEALLLPDEEAKERLYEIADEYPYSWPTQEHPNWTFGDDMLKLVNWNTVLHKLRLAVKDES